MSRVLLIHWNAAEAEALLDKLRRAGHQPEMLTPDGTAGLRALRQNPPEAFIIDLSRMPSHGRAVATVLRQQKATRPVPLVFAGGEPEKVERVRALFPDAVYTEWAKIGRALKLALANPPEAPVVPETMAGYSGTPLPKKLGIRTGSVVALLGAPNGFDTKLGGLPEGARVVRQARRPASLVVFFVESQADLAQRFAVAERAVADKGGLWIAWRKGGRSGLTGTAVRAFGLARQWVDYKICAIDDEWSGLLFARRKK